MEFKPGPDGSNAENSSLVLSGNEAKSKKNFKDILSLVKEHAGSEELKESAVIGIAGRIKAGDIQEAKNIMNLIQLSPEQVDTAVTEGVKKLFALGGVTNPKKRAIFDQLTLPAEKRDQLLQMGIEDCLLLSLENENPEKVPSVVNALLAKDIVPKEKFADSLLVVLRELVSGNRLDTAQSLREMNLISEEKLDTPEMDAAVITGLKKYLEKGDVQIDITRT